MEAVPIRNARRGDVPSLLLLWGAMMEENHRFDARLAIHPDAREHMSRTLSTWVDDASRVVLVAEEGGRLVVGYAAGSVGPGNGIQEPKTLGQVTDCYVLPARRRRGIGRRLAGRLFDLLGERGADAVRLQVVAKNAASTAFWQSMGWGVLEEILEAPARKARAGTPFPEGDQPVAPTSG